MGSYNERSLFDRLVRLGRGFLQAKHPRAVCFSARLVSGLASHRWKIVACLPRAVRHSYRRSISTCFNAPWIRVV